MNKQYVSVCLNITREITQVQETIVSCYDESKGLLPMIQVMSERFENSELIIITRNVDEHSNKFSNAFNSQYPSNVTIKFVGPGRDSKLSQIENLAWQHAIGDIVCYTRTIFTPQHINAIADRIDNQQVDFFIQHSRNRYYRPLDVSIIGAYKLPVSQKKNELAYLEGYVISRTTLNHVFYNQDQVYDVFVPLYTSKRIRTTNDSSFLVETEFSGRPTEFFARSAEAAAYDHNQNEEALNQYSPQAMIDYNKNISIFYGFVFGGIYAVIFAIFSELLKIKGSFIMSLAFLGSYALFVTLTTLVTYMMRKLHTIDLTTRQSAASAEHKRLTGFATIKIINKGVM